MGRMKIATFNVNGVNGRIANLIEWLEESEPDIVCLQELKTSQDKFPRISLAERGYHALWVGQKSYNGVAILSRGSAPIEIRRSLPGDTADTQGRFLEAAVLGIHVLCIYLPNGNPQPGPKFDYKLAWFERLIRHAADLYDCGHPVIIAGDFNVVPTDEVPDIYNPRSWKDDALLQPESRAAYRKLLKQGWTDAIHKLYPDLPMYTFWDYMRKRWERDAGLRIDHLLLNKQLKSKLVDAGVDKSVRGRPSASDHAPVWVSIKDPAASRATMAKRR
ncbi:MAG TPA: exodeoxyribonuclease III [Burkholderiales bacterium]|nr:exodeoxyribonuclease III [Burkholderiales bacterium]